jgi:RNA polymerase primary sigma factor
MVAPHEDMALHWLSQAGRQPLLTAAEEIHLGSLIRAWQDWEPSAADAPPSVRRRGLRARDRMVGANLRLVAHIAGRSRGRLGVQVADADLPDLFQAGAIGLQRGAELFDPARGYKFSTYAYWWIRQGISRWADSYGRTIRVPTTHSSTAAKLGRVASALTAELGRAPSRAELADALGVAEQELERLLLVGAGCLSLDCALPGSTGVEATLLGDLLAAADGQEQISPLRDELLGLIAQLDEQSGRLVSSHYGLAGPPATVAELAGREGITSKRVRQLLKDAENTLRQISGVDPLPLPIRPAELQPIPDGVELVQLQLLWPPAQ